MGLAIGHTGQDERLTPQQSGSPRSRVTTVAQGTRKSRPVLSVAPNGDMVLTENGNSRVVTPAYGDGSLRIGCTTIDAEALKRLRRLLDEQDAMQRDAELHNE